MAKSKSRTPVIPPHQQMGGAIQVQETHTIQSPVPPGEVLDRLAPHIERVGERWMLQFEETAAHQRRMELETLRVNEEVHKEALRNQGLAIRQDGNNIRRGQWIAGSLLLIVCLVFALLVWEAYRLFMSDKTWPAMAFTAFAGAIGWAFRSIVFGYLGKASAPSGKG